MAALQDWRERHDTWKDPVKREAFLKTKTDDLKKVIAENVEVLDVDDITDLGSGEPLFANFEYEDWMLLSIRFELHLLLHGFKKDLADPERPSFGEKHLSLLFNRYFGKAFDQDVFGVTRFEELVKLVKDALSLDTNHMLVTALGADASHDTFVKLTEVHRRERIRLLDAGIESAELRFKEPAKMQLKTSPAAGQKGGAWQHRQPYGKGQQACGKGPLAGGKGGSQQFAGQKRAYAPSSNTRPAKGARW